MKPTLQNSKGGTSMKTLIEKIIEEMEDMDTTYEHSATSILSIISKAMPKKKDRIYANGDLRELAIYHEKKGFNSAIDAVQTILKEI